jgi:hypothetical protein
MASEAFHYVGNELELFAAATNWKAYFARAIAPWVRGDVLEVGAGIASNTLFLHNPKVSSWRCLEPDETLAEQARSAVAGLRDCQVLVGTTNGAGLGSFDCLLYIDVLEHIEDDKEELERAAALVREGGSLIVLCPAHQQLYSEFDRALGHFRRYDAKTLAACGPSALELERVFYLDSVGLLASFANRALLKAAEPTPGQIKTWDRLMIPLSRLLDPCVRWHLGKSVVAAWQKPARHAARPPP